MVHSVVREERQLEADIRPELYRLTDDPGCLVDRFGEGGEARAQAERLHGQFVAFLEREGMRPDHVDHYRTLPL